MDDFRQRTMQWWNTCSDNAKAEICNEWRNLIYREIEKINKMESTKVLITIDEYNELKDFKRKIESEHCLKYANHYYQSSTYISTSDAMKEVNLINQKLKEEIESLKSEKELDEENANLKDGIKLLTGLIKNIKEMSFWEFHKWRKSQNNKD